MFLDRVMHFGKISGDELKGRSLTKLKSLIRVPYVAHLVLSFNMFLYNFRSVFLDRVIHFGVNIGDQVKGRSPEKLKSLIKVP